MSKFMHYNSITNSFLTIQSFFRGKFGVSSEFALLQNEYGRP